MTIINGIEIDDIELAVLKPDQFNAVQSGLRHNSKLEPRLHVVITVSNPAKFRRRYVVTDEFIERMRPVEDSGEIILYIVEIAYGDDSFHHTSATHPRHLQLRTVHQLWHKENSLNIAIKRLLPPDWRAVAWIDADLEFQNITWAADTLKLLNGTYDVVQLFSHCDDMNLDGTSMRVWNSAGYHIARGMPYIGKGPNQSHPGYAWAITREFYDKLGGLFEYGILGSGDMIMCLAFVAKTHITFRNQKYSENYVKLVNEYQDKSAGVRFGYVPGCINHHFHGNKANRQYDTRWKILVENNYDPTTHLKKDADGLLVPTDACPVDMLRRIKIYFDMRMEDETGEMRDEARDEALPEAVPVQSYVQPSDTSEQQSVCPNAEQSNTATLCACLFAICK